MIDIANLTESDKDRGVRYTNGHGTIEYGRIASWNQRFVFVRYHSSIQPNGLARSRFGETSEPTEPLDLEFTL